MKGLWRVVLFNTWKAVLYGVDRIPRKYNVGGGKFGIFFASLGAFFVSKNECKE